MKENTANWKNTETIEFGIAAKQRNAEDKKAIQDLTAISLHLGFLEQDILNYKNPS